jgi:hypothetical protein
MKIYGVNVSCSLCLDNYEYLANEFSCAKCDESCK